jgi:hypothetical protein
MLCGEAMMVTEYYYFGISFVVSVAKQRAEQKLWDLNGAKRLVPDRGYHDHD